jgi:hypothetical protein
MVIGQSFGVGTVPPYLPPLRAAPGVKDNKAVRCPILLGGLTWVQPKRKTFTPYGGPSLPGSRARTVTGPVETEIKGGTVPLWLNKENQCSSV